MSCRCFLFYFISSTCCPHAATFLVVLFLSFSLSVFLILFVLAVLVAFFISVLKILFRPCLPLLRSCTDYILFRN
ncbi:hypothetical protein BDZ97DRAFT_1795215 [Flammula alnicola]|nr:hypothetical protein BDZ97DRAFT_1795215 [Flammula alnicola]